MRKFRFVGDPNTYGWDEKPIVGKIYNGSHKGYCLEEDFESKPIQEWGEDEDKIDWQEVAETKPLHKDTDLGYFAGLVIQSLIADKEMSVKIASELAIETAKELIKRLENETNRH